MSNFTSASTYTCTPNPNYRPYHPSEDRFPRRIIGKAVCALMLGAAWAVMMPILIGAYILGSLGYEWEPAEPFTRA